MLMRILVVLEWDTGNRIQKVVAITASKEMKFFFRDTNARLRREQKKELPSKIPTLRELTPIYTCQYNLAHQQLFNLSYQS